MHFVAAKPDSYFINFIVYISAKNETLTQITQKNCKKYVSMGILILKMYESTLEFPYLKYFLVDLEK